MKIDLQQIKELLGIVSSTDVTELTIEFGDQKITVKKTPATNHTHVEMAPLATCSPAQVVHHEVAPRPAAAPVSVEAPPKADPIPAEDNGHAGSVAITSPMVGTFYGAPSPTASSFVKVGDKITVGQTVCIIEAMKLMNDLPSEVGGKIVKICVDSGTTVEYGQTLFLVDPKG